MGNDLLNGGDDNDTLDGGTGNDTLDGGLGSDSLIGGAGNDLYFIDNSNDKINESTKATGGKDTVTTAIDFSVETLLGVENIILTGDDDLNAKGNSAANQLTGNEGNNSLVGNAGNDTLNGGLGDDTLNGGTGIDKLIGGDGSDTYQINNKEDSIVENATDSGDDSIETSISFTLPNNLENLVLLGSTDLNGDGNSQDNTLEGNAGSNNLNGAAGDDTLLGSDGNDTLKGGTGNNVIDGGEGDDNAVFAEAQSNYILNEETNDGILSITVQNINDDSITEIQNIETLVFADNELDIRAGLSQELSLSIANVSIIEGNSGSKNASVLIKLSEATSTAFSVSYTTVDGDAQAGQDYVSNSGTVNFAVGEISKTITISVLGDTSVETNEQFFLQLSAPDNITLDTTEASITLTNDDKPQLSITAASLLEGNTGQTTASLVISLSAPGQDTVKVNYASANGTALAAKDYLTTTGEVSFAPGETSKTIAVPVLGDTLVEGNETFRMSLSAPVNASLSSTSSAIVTITDDDAIVVPSVSIVGATLVEGNSGSTQATLTVSLSAAASKVVSVNYATTNGTALSGSDYTASTGTLTFAIGETSKTFTVPVLGDTTVEANETFTISLTSPSNATLSAAASAVVTLSNDDVPSIAIANVSVAEGNVGNTANVTVTLSAASTQDISVNYTTADGTASNGSDYSATVGSLLFVAGETSKTISIPVLGDVNIESDENFTVALATPTNATLSANATATVTLTNDDQAVVLPTLSVTAASTVVEGNTGSSTASVTVTLSARSSQTVSVNYATTDGTATAGSDYTASTGTLSFAPGETSKTFTVPILGDADVETDENFTISLLSPVNASLGTSSTVITLSNDDIVSGVIFDGFDMSLSDDINTFVGSELNDRIYALGDADNIKGMAGDDYLDGGKGNDSLEGGEGKDSLYGGEGNDSLNGGPTQVYNENDVNYIDGGEGNDTLTSGNDLDTLMGGAGNDTLSGNAKFMNGGEGHDYITATLPISGYGTDTVINGDAGNDTLRGVRGNDTLNGGTGDDSLSGEYGNDSLNGEEGNDNLNGEGGNDSLNGGDGNDILTDLAYGSWGSIYSGNDTLNGGAGNDSLDSGLDNDTLIGGLGKDGLTGGAGLDKFVFSASDSGAGVDVRDVITDFGLTDKDILDLIDCSTAVLGYQSTKAFTAIDQVRYSFDFTLNSTIVQVNLDSNLATPEMEIQLTGLLALTATNFAL